MIATLKLGPYDAPSIEFVPQDIEPLVALASQNPEALTANDVDHIWSFLTLETLYLDEHSEPFFRRLESACREVLAGRIAQIDMERQKTSEFREYLRYIGDGSISQSTRAAAQRFIEFLEHHRGNQLDVQNAE